MWFLAHPCFSVLKTGICLHFNLETLEEHKVPVALMYREVRKFKCSENIIGTDLGFKIYRNGKNPVLLDNRLIPLPKCLVYLVISMLSEH